MMSLNCLTVLIQCQIFKVISSVSSESMEHYPLILTFKISSTGLTIVNRINNRLVFKIKDRHKLELQIAESIKSFGSTKKLQTKQKHGENVGSLEVDKVVLVQCNLAENQYQQKSEVLHTSAPSKSHAYLLNVKPSNFVFSKPMTLI